ncbi:hypothetical protein GCM10022227_44850 [Streptomyces sedi]
MDRDPTPGDPDEVRELADDLGEFADDVGEALGKIRGMAGERAVLDWAGLSADAFRREFDGVPDNLTKLEDSYSLCSQALHTYWPKLQTAQGMADRALDRAITAQADLASAQSALGDASDWVGRAGDEAERLQREGERDNVDPPDEADVRAAARDQQAAEAAAGAAQSQVNDAEERLSAARQLALDAQEMREEAARECARDIDEASDAGIQNRRWWEKAIKWATDNWDTLVEICKVIVAVLGIVVMIIGGPLAWVVLAAALVVLADTLIKYARGEAGLLDVAFAALDCIPGMKGLTTLGGLARGLRGLASTGLRGISAGVRGLGQGLRGMSRSIRRLFCRVDPIDMATGEVVMSATDVHLPGVLPLLLERHHRTSVVTGRCFGPSWASTLDQRILLRAEGVQVITADGMVLTYPRPPADVEVYPVEGPRWGLTWQGEPGTPMYLRQPERGTTLVFAPTESRPGSELPLTAVLDTNGNETRVEYGGRGAPVALHHSGGYHLGITTDRGRVTELRLLSAPDQPVLVRYRYDGRGNLSEVFNSSDRPMRFSYDDSRRLTGWRDRNDTWYGYRYDEDGRCVEATGSEGYLRGRVAYDAENHRTLFTDSQGHITTYEFNDCFQLLVETDPLGRKTHRTWDRYDNLVSLTDPAGHQTSYTYEHGNLVAVIRPDGRATRARYDERGLPVQLIEPNGAVWQMAYDARGNQTEGTDPTGAVTRYSYGVRGEMVSVVDALGRTTRVESDGCGLPLAVTTPLGATTRQRRDPFGRPIEITDPSGGVTRLRWNTEGKLTEQIDPSGHSTTWRWDGEGNCLAHTDENGGTTRYEYGPFDLPTAQVRPDGQRFEFHRDAELRLLRVVNPKGQTWEYTYDPAGQLVAESDLDGHEVRFAHDAAGRVTRRTNALGETVSFDWDALGRLVGKDVEGEVTRFEYDPLGRLVRSFSSEVELTLDRDPVGRVVAESVNGRQVRQSYDALGRLTTRTSPSGHRTDWRYDDEDNVASMASGERRIVFARDALGREAERHITGADGAALSLRMSWDPVSRLSQQQVLSGGRLLQERGFAYRPDHYLTELHEAGAPRIALDLDALGRVAAVHSGGERAETYTYDALGNQLTAHWGDDLADASGDRAYLGNRVSRAGRAHYHHDAPGRVVRRTTKSLSGTSSTWHYRWNAEDRLVEASTPDGSRWRYQYDGLGRRVAKLRLGEDGGVRERVDFSWSGTTLVEQLSRTQAEDRATAVSWQYHGLHPVAQIERELPAADLPQADVDERFYAIVTDLVGAPTELLDDRGHVVWRARTTVWGLRAGGGRDTAASVSTPLRFPGQYEDTETGWHYNVHRHYDPRTARYTSPDPLGLDPSPNPTGYVHNPLTWADPLGLDMSRVGRWMGDAEYQAMLDTGYVQAGSGGQSTYVAFPSDQTAYGRQAAPGSLYVEFDVPSDSLRTAGEPGWRQIPGPDNQLYTRLNARRGLPPPEMPRFENIQMITRKCS